MHRIPKVRRADAVNACTVRIFPFPVLPGNDIGRGREVANTDQLGAKLSAGTARKGSLAKGSWHGVAVTEGFTVGTSNSHKSNVETQQPIAPSGRELARR